jgi:hypothetical protein
MRSLALRLTAVALALVLALAVGELAARWMPRQGYRNTRVVDLRAAVPLEWPAMAEVAAALDRPKPEEVYRIVVIGDSFTWGDGVHAEDSYPLRLRTRLASLLEGRRLEVVVWSQLGWNTHQEVHSLLPALDRLAPDALILGYCLNDAEPTSLEERQALRREKLDVWFAGPADNWLHRNSRLYQRAAQSLFHLRSRTEMRAYYEGLYGDSEGWAAGRAALSALHRAAGRHRARAMVAIFPVFDSDMNERYAYRGLHQVVAEAVRAAGLEALDLLPAFEGVEGRRLPVIPYADPHPDELAHRIAADALIDYLVDHDWVPVSEEAKRQLAESRERSGKARPLSGKVVG